MVVNWYMRDLPYSYDILVENLTDPAHLPFSHHKLSPALKRESGGPMPFTEVDISTLVNRSPSHEHSHMDVSGSESTNGFTSKAEASNTKSLTATSARGTTVQDLSPSVGQALLCVCRRTIKTIICICSC